MGTEEAAADSVVEVECEAGLLFFGGGEEFFVVEVGKYMPEMLANFIVHMTRKRIQR